MIWVTGDCHGDFERFSSKNFKEGKQLNQDDYVIVCGDFGYWHDSAEQRWWFDWLNNKPWTTLFVDGNHENFDGLNRMEIKQWRGGKVHQINDKILHLMRGQIFNLQGYKFFTFGGAASHDISDGIIEPYEDGWTEKIKLWKKQKRMFRVNHYSWWKEEIPSDDEMDEGIKNLAANNYQVDYIITHDCPTVGLCMLYGELNIGKVNRYLESIYQITTFKQWYFGHHHTEVSLEKLNCLYHSIRRIV